MHGNNNNNINNNCNKKKFATHKPIISLYIYIYIYKQFLFNFLGASTLTFTNLPFLSNIFFCFLRNKHTHKI